LRDYADWWAAAQIAVDHFGGNLDSRAETASAKGEEGMQFPITGEPGAEKILMFAGALGVLALESNGLRVSGRVTPLLISRFAMSLWKSCWRTAGC
jgi:hypothetical protein